MIKEYIVQEEANGCAIASVAMLANVSYRAARKAIYPQKRFVNRYNCDQIGPTEDRELFAGMRRLGLKIKEYTPTAKLSINDIFYRLKNDSLLTMKMAEDGYLDYTHCYAWDAKSKKLYDPWMYMENIKPSLNYVFNRRGYSVIHVIEVVERC